MAGNYTKGLQRAPSFVPNFTVYPDGTWIMRRPAGVNFLPGDRSPIYCVGLERDQVIDVYGLRAQVVYFRGTAYNPVSVRTNQGYSYWMSNQIAVTQGPNIPVPTAPSVMYEHFDRQWYFFIEITDTSPDFEVGMSIVSTAGVAVPRQMHDVGAFKIADVIGDDFIDAVIEEDTLTWEDVGADFPSYVKPRDDVTMYAQVDGEWARGRAKTVTADTITFYETTGVDAPSQNVIVMVDTPSNA